MTPLDSATGALISEALGWSLVHALWQGAIVAASLAALLASFRSPRVRYVGGCVALLLIFISFAATLVYFWPGHLSSAGSSGRIALPAWRTRPDVNGSNSELLDLRAFTKWLAPVWICGVCAFYTRYAAGWVVTRRMRQSGVCKAPDAWQRSIARLAVELKISRPVVLLESLLADTPVVLGHFRPVILVPLGFLAGLSPDHVEAILLHELVHIRRSDYLINVCQRLIEGLLFYHPAVWWISHVIRVERENCCDDRVVELRGDVHGYAVALTALEQNRTEQQWSTREPAVAATGGNLMKRIKRLLYPKGPSGPWAPAIAAAVLLASSAVVMAGWGINSTSNTVSEQSAISRADKWQRWLSEDVVYIISDQEKAAFERLTTDEERQQFVNQFWDRRDPTPGTSENEFKEEHYRRIAYANKHWGGVVPGWKTDRGRIYIMHGPPDEIDSHPSGGTYIRPDSEGGGTATTHPFEDWRYSHFEGIGSLSIEFVDLNSSGDLRMTLDPNAKYEKP